MQKPVMYTIGHSTHPIDEFIELLKSHGIRELVDVRSIPMSRYNPQFNTDALKRSLSQAGINYRLLKKLGGRRHTKKDSVNLGWRNTSFRGYADYMSTQEFAEGMASLEKVAAARPNAIMCAEAVPWRCHRSLISDALIKRGWLVRDITSKSKAARHRLTPFLKMRKGQIVYPKP